MPEIVTLLDEIYLLPANNNQGFGYSQFIAHGDGNILLPRLKESSLSDCFDWIAKQGGLKYVLISDRHFAGPGCIEVAERFGAEVVISSIEAKAVSSRVDVPSSYGLEAVDVTTTIKAIPTPGHTAGQFSYLITTGNNTRLFTGDFIRWKDSQYIPGNKSRKKMQKSLDSLLAYQFSQIIGCTDYGSGKDSYIDVKDPEALIEELIAGCPKP